ncbi:ATP-binding cassette sub-family C member 4-like [Anthonomus grandis grandis]|uniref:ATP-binding cassette sub-family C member 4-like n=1 Tax=Anthonomus grandis grandis TaxID=2921223 RepID=UPI002166739D|nr:ATP-binding cassette sub-family C member 4-like [Anthonomus grandis grandis]XP_050309257.1 ATP-binding cassette sub-family C member 4-like [Anthonomus grandis grandis]XP_050309258.1 ATP-binding cassette sub-family C member 4-like [Anthonomus grandis grandis]XP_050309259.1 ATP-binding cassette sub-family C member 4-like [Anthonomus grandis grandis]XP_050309260.1 ATP-binding cassette sub-family C member 4-like [Anthonomus grandis grandis]XP_050309261.1 ATP-binding cassette sub-family C member
MDFTKENVNPNPRDKSTPFGILFFTYTFGMFKKGYSKTLQVDDLYNPIKSDRSMLLGDRLERAWNKLYEKDKNTKKKASLLVALIVAFWPEYTSLGINIVLMSIFQLVQPLVLGQLLDFFRVGSHLTRTDALWYAGAMSLCTFLLALLNNQYIMNAFHYGMRVRAASCALIYRKALRLSKTALGETASGKIVNLLSNDVSRFDLVTIFIHHMWVSPLTTIIILYFMWVDAGWAGILGIVTVFVVVPIQGYTGKLSAIYRKATALKTDERVRLMDEILSGIQVIKMYAWEKPFAKLIKYARKVELKVITKSSYVRGLYMTFNIFTTRLALFTTLLVVALSNEPITASKVFVIMSYLNIISQTMSQMFVRGISEIAELFVAIKRLEEFMLNDEFSSLALPQNNNEYTTHAHLLNLHDLTVKWNARLSDNALENINIVVDRGQLVGVIGPVGSGKSSLLQTILGELELDSGKLDVNGTVSYASQEAWVFAATVRQNILFGSEYDKKKYNDVVKACALERDFQQFPQGDLSIVGDRGASLSGGQKARINLARAIYRDADIYLLDDPLSAVDIHVSKHLYDQCINGYLYNKTRILVTHQVHHLKDADHIIILNNGRIENEGNFKQLSESDNLYAKLLTAEPELTEEPKLELSKKDRKMSVKSIKSLASAMSELSIPEAMLAEQDDDSEEEREQEIKLKDLQEESSKGKVKGNLFLKYFFAGGNCCFVLLVSLLYILAQVLAMGVDYYVTFWVKIEEYKLTVNSINGDNWNITSTNSSQPELIPPPPFYFNVNDWERNTFIYIYGTLVISLFLVALTRSMLFYKLAMLSSQKLHDSIFYSVIRASMRFFDTNPGGRILNRFSKDIGSVDELLPKAILDAAQLILMSVGSIILITIVNPVFLGVVAVIGSISMAFRHVYLKTSKNIKRLEGVMRSPVFTHLNATINGLTTIRAFGAQTILKSEFDKHQDCHTSAWFMFIAASSSFGVYMDLLCVVFTTAITFSFLTFGSGLPAGDVGLAITQAISLSMMVQWGLRQSAEVANQLMSVERVLEYKELPPEKEPLQPKKPPQNWPQKGAITFDNMGLRYHENGSLVLRNLNLKIDPNEKVGIVGRTGAGKSSLIAALFRLADVEGRIMIDDLDTKDLQLEQLRSKISIIPQDPVLFSGTLRYNLDPFEEYSDDVLYKAIEEVELKDPANIINRLESRVMDRGANYSVGQRQLICLARAIVRRNKILMLDEATANVDPQTDALIQKTIRKKFADCTVLTVAHRLNTIMDSDKVLVMESGTMMEFDHPYVLLQNPKSIFYNMVAESGKALSEQLKKVAKDSYQRQSSLPE